MTNSSDLQVGQRVRTYDGPGTIVATPPMPQLTMTATQHAAQRQLVILSLLIRP